MPQDGKVQHKRTIAQVKIPQEDQIIQEDPKKQPKVVPSILKGVSTPRKPRVGVEFQATLPLPQPSAKIPKEKLPENRPKQKPEQQ